MRLFSSEYILRMSPPCPRRLVADRCMKASLLVILNPVLYGYLSLLF